MGNVVTVELVSVDGVMESPEEWAFSYSNEKMEEANAARLSAYGPTKRAAHRWWTTQTAVQGGCTKGVE